MKACKVFLFNSWPDSSSPSAGLAALGGACLHLRGPQAGTCWEGTESRGIGRAQVIGKENTALLIPATFQPQHHLTPRGRSRGKHFASFPLPQPEGSTLTFVSPTLEKKIHNKVNKGGNFMFIHINSDPSAQSS